MHLKQHHIPLYLVSLPFIALILLRLVDFTVPYYNIDEITNAVYAKLLISGDMHPKDFLGNTYILTHYWYMCVYSLFPVTHLGYIHLFHLIWCLMTAYALKLAGDEMTGTKHMGFVTALFYVVTSLGFLSKDFRSSLSESLALLPMSLTAYFYFSFINKPNNAPIKGLLIGLFIGMAGLFKAPAISIIFAFWFSLFFIKEKKAVLFVYSALGLFLALLIPLFVATTPQEAFNNTINRLNKTKKYYINAYDNLPILYWGIKYFIRTVLILISTPFVTWMAIKTCQIEFVKSDGVKLKQREMILFCVFWFMACWFTVSLGKRVFYHYFVFLIPSLCLLATPFAKIMWNSYLNTNYRRVVAVLFLFIPVFGFTIESTQDWSLRKYTFPRVSEYIKNHTKSSDKIYVWGMVPQLYLFSERNPATTFLWSDTLAGTSPGSSGMESLRLNAKANVPQILVHDFKSNKDIAVKAEPITDNLLMRNPISDFDLLNNEEVLYFIASPHWIQVFNDFAKSPPELFLDTSPTGIRNFSAYPIDKFPLWRRFIRDNYNYEVTIDNIVIYRHRHKS